MFGKVKITLLHSKGDVNLFAKVSIPLQQYNNITGKMTLVC